MATFNAIDVHAATFRVLDALDCQLTGDFLWVAEQIDEDGAKGVVFRGFEEVEEGEPDYQGYVLLADTASDPDEPDTRLITQENLAEINDMLKTEISKQFAVQDWFDPQLNFVSEGRTSLMNGYKVLDEEILYQKVSCRLTLGDRKWVWIVCFKPDRAHDFGKSAWWTLENLKLL